MSEWGVKRSFRVIIQAEKSSLYFNTIIVIHVAQMSVGVCYEKDISAVKYTARAHTRFPCTQSDPGRPSGARQPSPQRPSSLDRI